MEQIFSALLATLQWPILLSMLLGLCAGIIVGAIPGLTASIGISLLIPLTFSMDPLFAFAMMAGIHNGGSYGGAIPAILLKIPGTPGAICTTLDGYPMAQQGRAPAALKIAAVSSAVGGTLSAIVLLLLAPPLAEITLAFGPPEIFWVNVFGLCSVAILLGDDPLKGLLAACFGLMIGMVGSDHVTGIERYTFDVLELHEGFPLLVVLVGMYALPPAWQMLEERATKGLDVSSSLKPDAGENMFKWLSMTGVWLKSSVIGIVIGLLPGVGGAASGFVAYNEIRRTAKDPDSFGKGNPLGVASSEASNNADNGASMVPALTLGVPGSGVAALMLGALVIHGMQPGPELFTENATVVYGYIWAMLITSIAISIFGGIIATKIFANVLKVPPVQLMPLIVGLTFVGIFTFQNAMFNVYAMFAFGLIGYAMIRLKFPIPPVVIGLVLGDNAENAMRISLLISKGDPTIFVTRPISLILVILIALILSYPLFGAWRARRKAAA